MMVSDLQISIYLQITKQNYIRNIKHNGKVCTSSQSQESRTDFPGVFLSVFHEFYKSTLKSHQIENKGFVWPHSSESY